MSKEIYIKAYFRAKWKLLCLLSFKSFSQHEQFLKIGKHSRIFPSLSSGTFGHVTHLDQSRKRK